MDYAIARQKMIESQLRCNRVTDPALLDAFAATGREAFLEPGRQALAYLDADLPIGDSDKDGSRYMLAPMVFGRLAQALELRRSDNLLLVGGGTFYEAAVLSRVVNTVFVVEADEARANAGADRLPAMGVDNVITSCGDHQAGMPSEAPFSRILVNGAVADDCDHPEACMLTALFDQLDDEGLLVAVTAREGPGRVRRFSRFGGTGGVVSGTVMFDAEAPVLRGFERKASFSF